MALVRNRLFDAHMPPVCKRTRIVRYYDATITAADNDTGLYKDNDTGLQHRADLEAQLCGLTAWHTLAQRDKPGYNNAGFDAQWDSFIQRAESVKQAPFARFVYDYKLAREIRSSCQR